MKTPKNQFWKVSTYVNSIEKYLGKLVDIILINDEMPFAEQLEYYKSKEGDGVMIEDDFKDDRVVRVPLLSHVIFDKSTADIFSSARGLIRHDSEKFANCISDIISEKF